MKDGEIEGSQKVLRDILILDPNNSDAANLLEEIEHNFAQAHKI